MAEKKDKIYFEKTKCAQFDSVKRVTFNIFEEEK